MLKVNIKSITASFVRRQVELVTLTRAIFLIVPHQRLLKLKRNFPILLASERTEQQSNFHFFWLIKVLNEIASGN
jgi:hypothetical protein